MLFPTITGHSRPEEHVMHRYYTQREAIVRFARETRLARYLKEDHFGTFTPREHMLLDAVKHAHHMFDCGCKEATVAHEIRILFGGDIAELVAASCAQAREIAHSRALNSTALAKVYLLCA
jgi:hypothetical protein